MKQFILLAMVCLCAYATKAQTITVNNYSGCDIYFQPAAGGGAFPCFQYVGAGTVVSAGSVGNMYNLGSFSWSPSTPPAGINFTYFRYINGDFLGGTYCAPTMGGTIGSCQYDMNHVGDCVGSNSCIETSNYCGTCTTGTIVNAYWAGGSSAVVDIY
jgi:hypothetical protein